MDSKNTAMNSNCPHEDLTLQWEYAREESSNVVVVPCDCSICGGRLVAERVFERQSEHQLSNQQRLEILEPELERLDRLVPDGEVDDPQRLITRAVHLLQSIEPQVGTLREHGVEILADNRSDSSVHALKERLEDLSTAVQNVKLVVAHADLATSDTSVDTEATETAADESVGAP
jgi:hypothetical protein